MLYGLSMSFSAPSTDDDGDRFMSIVIPIVGVILFLTSLLTLIAICCKKFQKA